jgi:RNA polymerase sigma factor (sigma-70 family)
MVSDGELLRRYVEDGSQAAYTELVQRHLNMVYLAALRQVGRNAHTADDVTQSVFTDLARKAGSLRNRPNLAGWLYTGTRFAAADAVRAERRRRTHEQESPTMPEADSSPQVPEDRLDPFLDEVMDLLPAHDREAVLLHFFEGRSFPEVGAVLAVSPDAARMRVNRALERMRAGFAKRGIASSAAALAIALASQSAIAVMAPTALAVASRAVSRAAASGGGGSKVGRLLQAAKSSLYLPLAGAALLIGVVGVSVSAFHRASPVAMANAAVGVSEVESDAEPPAPGSPPASVSPVPAAAPALPATEAPLPAAGAFAALSEPEKHILKSLWNGQENHPGKRVGLHVGQLAPNFADFAAGCDVLRARGWIRTLAAKPGTVLLTSKGMSFCRGNSAAIDDYPMFYENKKTPGF